MAKFDKFLSKLVDTAWKGVLAALDLRVTAVEAGEGIVNTMILVEDTILCGRSEQILPPAGNPLRAMFTVCRESGKTGYGRMTTLRPIRK